MNRKKILGLLAVMAMAGASLAGCQTDTSSSLNTVSDQENLTHSDQAALYENANKTTKLSVTEEQFSVLEQAVSTAIQNAGQSHPAWVSSVVDEDWLQPYFENGNVLKLSFAEARNVTIDSLPKTFDEVLILKNENWMIFAKDGQYENGPLMVSAEDVKQIFDLVKELQ